MCDCGHAALRVCVYYKKEPEGGGLGAAFSASVAPGLAFALLATAEEVPFTRCTDIQGRTQRHDHCTASEKLVEVFREV